MDIGMTTIRFNTIPNGAFYTSTFKYKNKEQTKKYLIILEM